jgi:ATP-dependent RNA helicase RhlE
MGFIHDLKRIVSRVPRERQTLMFSATMQPEIRRLADQWLRNPTELSVAPQGTPVERVEQSVYFVERGNKPRLLAHYLGGEGVKRAIVFMRTKHGADKLVRGLLRDGIRAEAIHGNKSQNARQRALAQFKSQHPPVLVATDIAARGLDIDSVTHVINFDLPMSAEIYVHRIGRTARAGAAGVAVTFCDREERSMLRDIERLTRQRLTIAKHELATGSEVAGEFRGQNARPAGSNRRPGGSNRPAGYAPNNSDKRGRRSTRPFNAGERTAGPNNRFKRRVAAV